MRPKKPEKNVSMQVYLTPSMKLKITRFAYLYNVSTSALLKMWITRQLAYEAKLYSKQELERERIRTEKEVEETLKMAQDLWGVDD